MAPRALRRDRRRRPGGRARRRRVRHDERPDLARRRAPRRRARPRRPAAPGARLADAGLEQLRDRPVGQRARHDRGAGGADGRARHRPRARGLRARHGRLRAVPRGTRRAATALLHEPPARLAGHGRAQRGVPGRVPGGGAGGHRLVAGRHRPVRARRAGAGHRAGRSRPGRDGGQPVLRAPPRARRRRTPGSSSASCAWRASTGASRRHPRRPGRSSGSRCPTGSRPPSSRSCASSSPRTSSPRSGAPRPTSRPSPSSSGGWGTTSSRGLRSRVASPRSCASAASPSPPPRRSSAPRPTGCWPTAPTSPTTWRRAGPGSRRRTSATPRSSTSRCPPQLPGVAGALVVLHDRTGPVGRGARGRSRGRAAAPARRPRALRPPRRDAGARPGGCCCWATTPGATGARWSRRPPGAPAPRRSRPGR